LAGEATETRSTNDTKLMRIIPASAADDTARLT
jgi:hypothetical protein